MLGQRCVRGGGSGFPERQNNLRQGAPPRQPTSQPSPAQNRPMRSLLEEKAGTDRTIGTTSNACRLVLFTSSNTEDAIQGTEGDKGSQKRNDSDQAHPANRAMQDSDQRKEPKCNDDSDATINGTNISLHGKSLLLQSLPWRSPLVGNQSYKACCCAANSRKAWRLSIVTNPRSRPIQPRSSNRPSNRVIMTRTLPNSSAIS